MGQRVAGPTARLVVRRRPVGPAEIDAMRRMAGGGAGTSAVATAFDRHGPTVRRYCGDLLPKPERSGLRLLCILEIAESSQQPRAVLARALGFASAGSLGAVLTRARKARASLAEEAPPCS